MGLGSFADAVDALFADNARLVVFAAALFGVHVLVAIAAVVRRRAPLLIPGLNLVVAVAMLLYKASQYAAHPALIGVAGGDLAGSADLKLVLFEAAVAVVAGYALARRRVALALSGAAFLVHALAAAALPAFVFAVHIDRLS
jgi:hypothetical protein